MKKNIILLLVFSVTKLFSQVGINTTTPKATLDVVGKPTNITVLDGIIAPRLTGDQLKAKTYTIDQKGAIVYITAGTTPPATGQVINVIDEGYYYFDSIRWVKIGVNATKEQFYAPSIVLPTEPLGVSANPSDDISFSSDTFTVKLHSLYEKQFGMIGDVTGVSRTAIKSNSTAVLKKYNATELDYFITYFDNTVFDPSSITLSSDGILTYKVLSTGVVSEKTFMNFVFKVK